MFPLYRYTCCVVTFPFVFRAWLESKSANRSIDTATCLIMLKKKIKVSYSVGMRQKVHCHSVLIRLLSVTERNPRFWREETSNYFTGGAYKWKRLVVKVQLINYVQLKLRLAFVWALPGLTFVEPHELDILTHSKWYLPRFACHRGDSPVVLPVPDVQALQMWERHPTLLRKCQGREGGW